MAQKKAFDVELGSENVFEDLGFEAEEAVNLKIRADLMLDLCDSPTERFCHRIQKQGWTQKEAAKLLGETQPSISNLMSGEISRFSIDKLINLLGKVGMEVRIEVVSKAA